MPIRAVQSEDFATDYLAMQMLCAHSPIHRNWTLKHMAQWLVVPIQKRHYLVFVDEKGSPVGFVTWAWLNTDTARQYCERVHLRPNEHCSGEQLWFLDFVSPFGHTRAMVRYLAQSLFKGRRSFSRRSYGTGKTQRVQKWIS